MRDRYESLQPPSLIASIASMPRRWKDALHVPAPKNIDDVFTMEGPNGVSAAEHLGAAISLSRIVLDALRTTSYNIPEPLGPDVAAAVQNSGSGAWPATAAEGLADLTKTMEDLLEKLQELTPSDWNKSADSAGQSFTVLALAQGASRVAADRLTAVDQIITALAR